MGIRALRAREQSWVAALVSESFSVPRVVSRGVLHDVLSLPGLVAERSGAPVGLLPYRVHQGDCEVVVRIAARRREGVGRRLLAAARPVAEAAGCGRLWLVTTNTNRAGLTFYRAMGWTEMPSTAGRARGAASQTRDPGARCRRYAYRGRDRVELRLPGA